MAGHLKPNMVPENKAFFFSGFSVSENNKVKSWAQAAGLTHVGIAWKDANFVNVKNYEDGNDPAKVAKFRDDFSAVFAQKSKGVAYIMIKGDGEPASSRTFARAEFPQIKSVGEVTKIIKLPSSLLDENTRSVSEASGTQFWAKGDADPKFA